jgi:hypothetical protein
LHILVPPVEAIAIGIIATVGVPLCAALLGYLFGTTQADRYFRVRVESIDRILDHLERSL